MAWGYNSFDIFQLTTLGNPGFVLNHPTAPGVINSLSGPIMTVTVAGKVYPPEDVNYYLYGAWLRVTGTSLDFGIHQTIAHRVLSYSGTGTGPRIAWIKAGYYQNFNYAAPTAIAGAQPQLQPYNGPLSFELGQGNSKLQATVFGNGLVLPNVIDPTLSP